jgi:hypothetical protein
LSISPFPSKSIFWNVLSLMPCNREGDRRVSRGREADTALTLMPCNHVRETHPPNPTPAAGRGRGRGRSDLSRLRTIRGQGGDSWVGGGGGGGAGGGHDAYGMEPVLAAEAGWVRPLGRGESLFSPTRPRDELDGVVCENNAFQGSHFRKWREKDTVELRCVCLARLACFACTRED